jgi:hypothetical protein
MFPWICVKCGKVLPNRTDLLDHILSLGHDLSTEETHQFCQAMTDIQNELILAR